MTPSKTAAAAVAAVFAYLQTEEAALVAAALSQGPARIEGLSVAAPPTPALNVWGLSGRQDIMSVRNMMQLKAFHGARLR